MAEVRLENIWKVFDGRVEAVRQVDAFVPNGSFCVLVGPSGCGKSTTLRMIAGLEEISEGTVSIGGRVVNGVAPKDRDIAMVFQNYALYPHMTVEKNLSFALQLRGMKKDEIRARVGEAAEQLGLTGLLKRKPGALSGGQRQRVALGRALVREPAVFLFDEPLSNLDAKLRGRTRADLKALHRRLKATMIYVTHDQEEAMSLGDMIVVMADGEVQQTGAPLDVFDRPANRFVAGFIGTPPMNFLDGSIEPDGDAIVFTEAGAANGDARPARLRVPGCEGPAEARPAVLGIRPQAVSVAAEGTGREGLRFTIRVDMVEPLGEQVDVHARTPAGSPVVFRLPARTDVVAAGGDLELEADAGRLRLFEPGEFGASLGSCGTTHHATSTAPTTGAATHSIGDEHG